MFEYWLLILCVCVNVDILGILKIFLFIDGCLLGNLKFKKCFWNFLGIYGGVGLFLWFDFKWLNGIYFIFFINLNVENG